MSADNTQTHHILPIRLGGTENSSNLIQLTVSEHAEAHRVLYEHYKDIRDFRAYKSLLIQANDYEKHQETRRKYMTERVVTSETCNKLSESKRGIVPWAATKAAAKANTGRAFSKERIENMSGKNNHNYGSEVCNIPIEKRLEGFCKVTPEQRSTRTKGKRWWNNGIVEIRSETQPDGFTRGRNNYAKSI